MSPEKVDMYIMSNKDFFPSDKIMLLREKLLATDEAKFIAVSAFSMKNPTTFLILSILLGVIGIDRFMLGDIGMGILKLLTWGLCLILWIVDICTIMNKVRERNYNDVMLLL